MGNMNIDQIYLRMKETANQLHQLYLRKNHDYGDSFALSFKEYGVTMSFIRIEDKLRRLKSLSKSDAQVKDESIMDTILDIANYAVMTAMELCSGMVGKTVSSKADMHPLLFGVAFGSTRVETACEDFSHFGVLNYCTACVETGLKNAKSTSSPKEMQSAFLFIAAYAALASVFLAAPSLLVAKERV